MHGTDKCDKCGSTDLYETKHLPPPPDAGVFTRLFAAVRGSGIGSAPRSRWGRVYVVCRNCGHVCSVMQVM
ncbi:MAG: hypothetical protein IJ228_12515 [Succinivibrio sp.]|nr:hypothetical protein [Succinivibrio sp.]